MIHLAINPDDQYLDTLRHKKGYNPFSHSFDMDLNRKLYKKAKSAGATQSTLNLISSGEYFHEKFFKSLFKELTEHRNRILLPREELMENFCAFLNEQLIFNRDKQKEFIDSLASVTPHALHQGNFTHAEAPSNPQNFKALDESIIDYGTTFIRFLFFNKAENFILTNEVQTGEQVFAEIEEIFKIINKFEELQSHYVACLYFNGNIELSGAERIYFDACIQDFFLIQQISIGVVSNQRMNRMHYYTHHSGYNNAAREMMLKASPQIIEDVVIENGIVSYTLKKRSANDYDIYVDYLSSVLDYYPFYMEEPLVQLAGLCVDDLLKMHSELAELASKIYFKEKPDNNSYNLEKYRADFLPRIEENTLKNYLLAVTGHSEEKITMYIDLITAKFSTDADFFSTPLVRKGEYYYFPTYSFSHPNYLYLIDYWLEEAGISLDHRGKAFEKYLKVKLKQIPAAEHNRFKVLDQNMFKVNDNEKEQIDLLIETKTAIILCEVKCVKYPMQRRDYYGIYKNIILKATAQLNRKEKFLEKHADLFSDVFTIKGKKIVKLVILNYPFFVTVDMENIVVTDANLFLAYFSSGRMVARRFNNEAMEEVDAVRFYNNEDEFCDNIESTLSDHPAIKSLLPLFKKQICSYQLEGMPVIDYSTYVCETGFDRMEISHD